MSEPSPQPTSGLVGEAPPGFALPKDATAPVRFPHAPAPGTVLASHFHECYGCGPDEKAGLHLVATAGDGVDITAEMAVTRDHQGAPGLAHGGLIATAFDEALGFLLWLLGAPAVTARLAVDYRRPVPIGHALHLTARCTGVAGRKIYGYASAHLDMPTGPLVAEASGLFVIVDGDHFTRHGAPSAGVVMDGPFATIASPPGSAIADHGADGSGPRGASPQDAPRDAPEGDRRPRYNP